jgi:hypothetical protein
MSRNLLLIQRTTGQTPTPPAEVSRFNGAEGYTTDGTVVTAANSGAGPGETAFSVVTSGVTARSGDGVSGSWCYELTPPAGSTAALTLPVAGTPTALSISRYTKLTGYPSATIEWSRAIVGAVSFGVNMNIAGAVLLISPSGSVAASGSSLPLNVWFREELRMDTGGGGASGRMAYAAYAMDGTPICSGSASGVLLSGSTPQTTVHGKRSATGDMAPYRFDAITVVSNRYAEIGPVSAAVTVSVADGALVTDAVLDQDDRTRIPADLATLTDALSVDLATSLSDVAVLADAATGQAGSERSGGDPAALTDALSAQASRGATVADALSAADAATTQTDRPSVLADGLVATDALSVARAATLSDFSALTDQTSADRAAGLVDVLAGSDAPVAVRGVDRSLPDLLAATDALTVSRVAVLGDALAGTDAPTGASDRVLSDAGVGTDALTTDVAAAQLIEFTDQAQITDALTSTTGLSSAVTDPASGTDALTVARAVVVSDQGTLLDSLSADRSRTVSQADALTATDSATAALAVAQAVEAADSVQATDALGVAWVRVIADPATGVDTSPPSGGYMGGYTAGYDAPGQILPDGWRPGVLADPLRGTDAVSLSATRERLITDSAPAVDAVTVERTGASSASLGDASSGTDQLAGAYSQPRPVTDPLTVLDQIEATWARAAVLADTEQGSDGLSRGRTVTIGDPLTVADLFSVFAGLTRDLDLTPELLAARYALALLPGRYSSDLSRDRFAVNLTGDRYASDVDAGRYEARVP